MAVGAVIDTDSGWFLIWRTIIVSFHFNGALFDQKKCIEPLIFF